MFDELEVYGKIVKTAYQAFRIKYVAKFSSNKKSLF